ncbi:threonine--tRNA ligase [Campylobacter hyointestinalis]|uniref:Threonine--tRNA ligase n=2 Tax=Campylobacter hyointestinalis subsp. hyointestinalis TaxID=91352 RepID=A0A2S5JBG2_CAMHY|nr:threonine--tRNA ligase [Campylobacter hyointestinalis]MBT0611387.1 threonine--tRNA ligase [Campylobacter hyointestinalis subsp. hyointestinalis]MDY2999836.1 threonine--tRNA ligase [Campylobacter hyointestinalis]PPB56592.1 threonine--tRNA ligase [Campylobacter hyointestinalis subsp. hyointestinalis]PPB59593.1 threonine--tRNA ligase [Campylobacter hyointestinalis subsp. hyointestinalis]PPB64762.1 threonine--tRNA ligase [Campylobacter hyointestinalis subsp. hyointestinalis]
MMSDVIAYKVNGEIVDTQSYGGNGGEEILFDNSKEALDVIRHSCAHLMAAAIKELYPNAKFFVGPSIEDGFYYDMRVSKNDGEKLGESDLEEIEKKMKELALAKIDIVKFNSTKSEVAAKYASDDLKQEVLKRIPDGVVSLYSQGNFEDICRGPHVPNTIFTRFFKLTRIAGAYLGGDENREMLTRIYGTAYADKESLKEHIRIIEEAKKRDHRKLGAEMKFFTFDDDIGVGLPIWLPNGARLRSRLEHKLYRTHRLRGYEPVRGPEILKSDAWKISGHYANYKENMYFTVIDEQEYGIKPMNCVGHIKVYQSEIRSYRDLPLKFFEYGVVHRHEKSGVLHGLFRVREFTQDDAHLFCMPSQIKENVYEILSFVDTLMGAFGFTYEMEISTKPAKAVGDDEIWEIATKALKDALDEKGLKYGIDEGGGAFYGPKIDIKITDALKRKWQCGTVQVDFNLPKRFELSYVDENNEKKQPVMLHRAILGSFERFIGILLEHTAGELPFWIAPTQVVIIPIGDDHLKYAKEIYQELLELGVDSEISSKNETLNKKIRTAEKQRVPMIIVLGDNEVANRGVALRDRRAREQKDLSLDEFLSLVKTKLNEVNF